MLYDCILLSKMLLKDQALYWIGNTFLFLLYNEEDVFKFVFQGLVLQASSDEAETLLLKDVEKILKSLSVQGLTACDRDGRRNASLAHGCMKRIVISHLQKLGYNAAICKSRWDHSGSVSAGMNNNNLPYYITGQIKNK